MSQLLNQVLNEVLKRNYSLKTTEAYILWIKRFIIFNDKQHPNDLDETHIQKFLDYLALNKNYSPSTQRVALNAVVFLYKFVIKKNIGDFSSFIKAKRKNFIPVVFSKQEVNNTLANLKEIYNLIYSLQYGAGLRLSEVLRLRIKDVDFDYKSIIIHDAKGHKDRVTVYHFPLLNSCI